MQLEIEPFEMGTEKEAALKPLEEAAEVYGAWQVVDGCRNECGECSVPYDSGIGCCVQACANLAARYGIDLDAAMRRCHERNRERGRCD